MWKVGLKTELLMSLICLRLLKSRGLSCQWEGLLVCEGSINKRLSKLKTRSKYWDGVSLSFVEIDTILEC